MDTVGGKIKFFVDSVDKFIEHNLMEKEHRDENLRKLANAFNNLKNKTFTEDETNISKKVPLQIKKLAHFKGELPKYQSAGASGLDVRAQLSEDIMIAPGARDLIPTGLSMAVPQAYEIQARPRSGLAIREGLTLLNTPGTIDADYRGEVKIIVINLGAEPITIKDQDRIAQLVIAPVIHPEILGVDELDETVRGAGGFGSTGKV